MKVQGLWIVFQPLKLKKIQITSLISPLFPTEEPVSGSIDIKTCPSLPLFSPSLRKKKGQG